MIDMRIVPADEQRALDWIRPREDLYGPGPHTVEPHAVEPHAVEIAQVLESPEHDAYLLLDARGRACGLLELSLRNLAVDRIAGPIGYVEGLYLDPDARGHGFAELLMAHAEAWSRARGAVAMATDSQLENVRSHGFYERLGNHEVDRAVHFAKPL
jgi:aminoglycoside 6'-N-acetyltransferase I